MPHEKPVLCAVGGCTAYQAVLFKRLAQLPKRIALRAHLSRVPVGQAALIHLEPVMMLRHRNDILCPRFFKKTCPFLRVKFFRFEHGDEILIAKLFMRAIGFYVMLKLRRALDIHVTGIPFIAKRGHAVNSPMDENSKFGGTKPFRYRVRAEGIPCILIRTAGDHLIDLF